MGDGHMTYRLLTKGDFIQKGDEVLSDDTLSWRPLVGWEISLAYWPSVFQPVRRAIAIEGEARANDPSPTESGVGTAEG